MILIQDPSIKCQPFNTFGTSAWVICRRGFEDTTQSRAQCGGKSTAVCGVLLEPQRLENDGNKIGTFIWI